MGKTESRYSKPRPDLTVESTGGRRLGNCYSASYFRVTSRTPLDRKKIDALASMGVLGYGQEFFCRYVNSDGVRTEVPPELDWRSAPSVVPTGRDPINMVEVDKDTEEVIRIIESARVPSAPYYVYECESRVDSGD